MSVYLHRKMRSFLKSISLINVLFTCQTHFTFNYLNIDYQFTEDLRRTGTTLQDYTALIKDVEFFETHLMIGFSEMQYGNDYVGCSKHFLKSLWLRDDVVEPAAFLAFVLNTGLVPDSLAEGVSKNNTPMYYSAGLKSENAFIHYQLGVLYYNGIGEAVNVSDH